MELKTALRSLETTWRWRSVRQGAANLTPRSLGMRRVGHGGHLCYGHIYAERRRGRRSAQFRTCRDVLGGSRWVRKVALQIFQTNRKLHRPNTTGRGGASRAEAEARHSLSLSLSHITAETLVVVHTQLHGPKKRSIGTLKNAKIPRPKNQPCALPTRLRARECARGKRGVANGREVAATGFFVSIEGSIGELSRRRVSSVHRGSSCARRRQPWSGTCGHQPARPRAWMGPGAGHQQSCAALSALLERVRLCSRRGPRTASPVSARGIDRDGARKGSGWRASRDS